MNNMREHYKLYKAGKLWLTACIVTLGMIGYSTAYADDQQPTTNNQSGQQVTATTQTATNEQSNQKTAPGQSTSNNDDVVAAKNSTESTEANTSVDTAASNNRTTTTANTEATTVPTNLNNGWNNNQGNWYYVNNGVAAKNWQRIDNDWYYFSPTSSVMQTGLQNIQNATYYLNEQHDGRYGAMLTGWQKVNNNWYYFAQNGAAETNWQQINHNWYYFNTDGAAQTGWFKSNAGYWYYFDPMNAWSLRGWQQINHNWYYFNQVNTNAETGWQRIDNRWYYFDPTNTNMLAGPQQINGHTYYLNEQHDGTYGAMLTGWQRAANGNWYYLNNNGAARTNWQLINHNWYYFNADGAAQTGWFKSGAGYWYYFDPTNAWSLRGWQQINHNWYYFNQVNTNAETGWQKIDNQWYYFDPTNTNMLAGLQRINGHTYYLNDQHDGTYGAMKAGWQQINGHWYGFGGPDDGAAYTGWHYINNQWYYFNNDGQMMTGLQQIPNDGTYYLNDQGIMQTGWQQVNNDWYHFAANGAAQQGWQRIDNQWYYFTPTTSIMQAGLQQINGHIYYLNEQHDGTYGAMLTGWQKVNSQQYYFGADGAAVTGKQTIDNKDYVFNDNGVLQPVNYARVVDGKLNIYNTADNKLVRTVEPGTWENAAYSLDSNSVNNINGYLSYSGWYRPYGTSQDGKTWYPTTASDWRPILMYAWPDSGVEAQFIKYFVNHGYENADYGLTKDSVANLSKDTSQTTLDNTAQNLRYVIEQHIAANKSTSQLANDVNAFMQTVPALSAESELSIVNKEGYQPDRSGTVDDDQVIFVNNNSTNQTIGNTSYADSNYRLMNRTINNQTGTDNSDNSPELLVGNDIDNSNPVVQAENMNWEYFLLNYGRLMGYNADGNFDGFRIDAADNIDADVLDQVAQLMNDLYHTKGNPTNLNNHLIYNEGYHSGAANMLNQKGNPELFMDAGLFYTLENVLGRPNYGRDTIHNLITNSVVNRANDTTENQATPNWSFVTNHDQRKNVINQIIIDDHPGQADIMANGYRAEYAKQAWDEFYRDERNTDKSYAQYNVPAQYAILLSNKDTVPQVYYGDLYDETDQYMQTKSMYYDAITTLMKARHEFVSGGQTMTQLNDHLLASVRYGKGVTDANAQGTDALSRTTGMAVLVGNDANMAQQEVAINMGKAHANQEYKNLIDSTDNGLTYDGTGSLNPATLRTDANGILHVTVKGYSNPYVSGYLSVWVPVISGNQDATTAPAASSDSNKYFESNAALDSHMIYEDFSLFEPEPTSQSEHAYNVIAQHANDFANLGITDFWMAPAYTPFNMSRYNEGYSMTDRYNLGTAQNPTKYGSGEELSNTIAALHRAGLKVQEDLVMNQMIGFSSQEAVTVTRANSHGQWASVNGQTYANQIYFAYTRGGGDGQKQYGGRYLDYLKTNYPDLFTTKAASTGVAPDPNTRITEWSAKYQNGTSLQNIGIGLAVKLANGDYAYLNSGDNKAFNTLVPDVMSLDHYANA